VGADAQVRRAVPLLTRVTPFVGHFQIRNPAIALTLDAAIEALSPRGRREIAAADFFTGLWETTMESDEVLTGVRFPLWNSRSGFSVHEFSCRHGDFAIEGALVAVRLDDQDRDCDAVRSCLMFAVQADGMEVTTVEGIASLDGTLSPVQAALRECHGLQCGFCTPGFVMSLTALLRDNPDPTDDEIREGLSGNFCRCTGYQGIVAAAHRAAEAMSESVTQR
jgi:xanthine dehydrogenase iron-sulfur cluster and FAD-binding subunit A